ncbi:MAG: ABC transporter ATP-binding protein [Alphaproteobacteria bacterium]|nr:ABC transporter ATP-binding protein [Alphaproteobacteria bacterium]
MVWRFLYKYIKQAKYLTLGLFILLAFESVLSRYQNYLVANMIGALSAVSKNDITSVLFQYLLLFVFALLSASALHGLRQFLEARFLPFIYTRTAKDLFSMVHKHAMRFFEEEMSGNISGKVSNVLSQIQNMYGNILFGMFMPLMAIATSLFFIALEDKRLALILGLLNLIFLFITIYFRKQIAPLSAERSKMYSAANGVFVDGVANASLVKSFANYFYEKHLYFKAVRKAAKAEKKEMMKTVFVDLIAQSIFDIMTLASFALVFWWWHHFGLSLAGVVLVTSLVQTFINAIRHMGWMATSVVQLYGNIKDCLSLLELDCYVQDKENAKKLKIKTNDVVFDKVCFAYPNGKNVFKNFNLHIAPNKKIGLVGVSGSGKSTLIKLLVRYYDVLSGKILVGGKDISDVSQESLRAQIAMIPQESTLFNRTLMENIRYGNPKATDRQVIAAAKKAHIHDFIESLPLKYESKVGERGVMLSGGERQRVAIARAILKNAPILILDEATSALDSQSERYIQQSLAQLMVGKTVIAIAHRLSTLHEMDEIIVFEKGKIVERGSHNKLYQKDGKYAQFYKIQANLER